LHAVVSSIGGRSFTVLYTTTPLTAAIITPTYEMDHQYDSAPHQELKRAVDEQKEHSVADDAPLFEKYVFVSPG